MDRSIKPHLQQQAEQEARQAQRQVFLRNQAIGLLLLALGIVFWWVFHTKAGWVFPAGWWRP